MRQWGDFQSHGSLDEKRINYLVTGVRRVKLLYLGSHQIIDV